VSPLGSLNHVVAIVGPTAVGKTAVAIALADRYPVDLISMDSALIYRGMDIGTAKPDLATRRAYPHGLLDIRDPSQPYSAAEFVADADTLVRSAWAAGRLPVLVGGTMMYLRAFREGLADLPQADPGVRAALALEAEARGWPALHAELQSVDPAAAQTIHPNNAQRLQRALEVYRVSGKPISAYWHAQRDAGVGKRLGAALSAVALLPESRPVLHERIMLRFCAMLAGGLIEEVQALRGRGDLHAGLPAMRAVGYRQTWQYLDGEYDYAELVQRGAAATRQLAKRQLTWLRSWDWLQTCVANDSDAYSDMVERVVGGTTASV
jgi:tRNA dimethylallyltransferase